MNITHEIVQGKKGEFKLRNKNTGAVGPRWLSLAEVQEVYARTLINANSRKPTATSEIKDRHNVPSVVRARKGGRHTVEQKQDGWVVYLGAKEIQRGMTRQEAFSLKYSEDAKLQA